MDKLVTYLRTATKYFFPKKNLVVQPSSVELVDSAIVRLRTQNTKCIGKLITGHIPIVFNNVDNITLAFPNDKITTITRKLRKVLINTLEEENKKKKKNATLE